MLENQVIETFIVLHFIRIPVISGKLFHITTAQSILHAGQVLFGCDSCSHLQTVHCSCPLSGFSDHILLYSIPSEAGLSAISFASKILGTCSLLPSHGYSDASLRVMDFLYGDGEFNFCSIVYSCFNQTGSR